MRITSCRVLVVVVASGGLLLGGAAPALALDASDMGAAQLPEVPGVPEVPGLPGQDEEGPLQPVTDLVCGLTGIALLGECAAEEPVTAPAPEKPKPAKPVPGKGDKDDAKGAGAGDKGEAPVGGVETGAGGTADDGAGLLLPLGLLGGAGLAGGAAVALRRLRADQVR